MNPVLTNALYIWHRDEWTVSTADYVADYGVLEFRKA